MYDPSKFDLPVPETRPVDEIGERLLKAAQIIRERGWCQGSLHLPSGEVCAVGAIEAACEDDGLSDIQMEAQSRLTDHVYGQPAIRDDKLVYVARWNDYPGRTAEEVIRALEMAARS